MGLKKVIVDMMKKKNITSYLDFALNIAKLPKQLFDVSTENNRKRLENFDRAGLITYSFCLAKPALHASGNLHFKNQKEKQKIYVRKYLQYINYIYSKDIPHNLF